MPPRPFWLTHRDWSAGLSSGFRTAILWCGTGCAVNGGKFAGAWNAVPLAPRQGSQREPAVSRIEYQKDTA
jgi:hypothetical protein